MQLTSGILQLQLQEVAAALGAVHTLLHVHNPTQGEASGQTRGPQVNGEWYSRQWKFILTESLSFSLIIIILMVNIVFYGFGFSIIVPSLFLNSYQKYIAHISHNLTLLARAYI